MNNRDNDKFQIWIGEQIMKKYFSIVPLVLMLLLFFNINNDVYGADKEIDFTTTNTFTESEKGEAKLLYSRSFSLKMNGYNERHRIRVQITNNSSMKMRVMFYDSEKYSPQKSITSENNCDESFSFTYGGANNTVFIICFEGELYDKYDYTIKVIDETVYPTGIKVEDVVVTAGDKAKVKYTFLPEGCDYEINNRMFTCIPDSVSIASSLDDGVYGIKAGTTYFKVKDIKTKLEGICMVTVLPLQVQIKAVGKTNIKLQVDKYKKIKFKSSVPMNKTNVYYESTNLKVADVDQQGKIKAVGLGKAKIKIICEDGNTIIYNVTVNKCHIDTWENSNINYVKYTNSIRQFKKGKWAKKKSPNYEIKGKKIYCKSMCDAKLVYKVKKEKYIIELHIHNKDVLYNNAIKLLKRKLVAPNSLVVHQKLFTPSRAGDNVYVNIDYSAKNRFGGYDRGNMIAYYQNGKFEILQYK